MRRMMLLRRNQRASPNLTPLVLVIRKLARYYTVVSRIIHSIHSLRQRVLSPTDQLATGILTSDINQPRSFNICNPHNKLYASWLWPKITPDSRLPRAG